MLFADRTDAGRRLARSLSRWRGTNVVVLALPRGGVPVASEVARELRAPLDMIVVRKLGVPFQPEYGFGAIGEGGARVVDDHVVRQAGLTRQEIASAEARERVRLDHLLGRLRGGRPPVPLAGRTALVVDDAIATGATARAACLVARARGARRVIVAVPVGATEAVAALRRDADEVTCLHTVPASRSVGAWYGDFAQVTDAEATALLGPGRQPRIRVTPRRIRRRSRWTRTACRCPGRWSSRPGLRGWWSSPTAAAAAGTARAISSWRPDLNRAGFGTLLVDLLTADEELSRACVFDVALLAARLTAVTRWLGTQPATAAIPAGYFGVSTGAAAALAAVTDTPRLPVTAIVSLGGRPDLVGARLARVRVPTLLIVGGADRVVLGLNQRARAQLTCESQARRHSRRDRSARGTGSPRPGDGPDQRLVRPPLRAGGQHRGRGLRAFG